MLIEDQLIKSIYLIFNSLFNLTYWFMIIPSLRTISVDAPALHSIRTEPECGRDPEVKNHKQHGGVEVGVDKWL